MIDTAPASDEQPRLRARQLKALLSAIDESVLLLDRTGAVAEASDTAVRRLAGREPLPGASLWDLLPEASLPTCKKAFREVLETGAPVHTEDAGDGGWIAPALWSPVVDEKGRVEQVVVLVREFGIWDVCERGLLEEDLRHADRMKAIGTLAGGTAHDLNNILGIIVGNAELALADLPSWSPVRKNLREVRRATLRARELVKQILHLSRPKEDAPPPGESGAGEAAEPGADLPRGFERILFVDDEPMIMDLGQRMLERQGYDVEAYGNGAEALEVFNQDPDCFDLVVTDMTMPGMRGDHLAVALSAIRPDIPVILITGYSDQICEEKAGAIGIRAFVLKPLTQRELVTKVREVLDEQAGAPGLREGRVSS